MHRPDYESLNRAMAVCATDPFTPDRYRQFARHLPAGASSVLDVGCSTGRGGAVLRELRPGLTLVGADCLAESLAAVPEGVYDETFCGDDLRALAADRRFDAILAGEFVEHLHWEDGRRMIAACFDLLNPGGRLLLTTPNPQGIKLRLTGGVVTGGAHLSQYTASQMRKLLLEAGFSAVRFRGSGKTTWYLGDALPWINLYGSYLALADKGSPPAG